MDLRRKPSSSFFDSQDFRKGIDVSDVKCLTPLTSSWKSTFKQFTKKRTFLKSANVNYAHLDIVGYDSDMAQILWPHECLPYRHALDLMIGSVFGDIIRPVLTSFIWPFWSSHNSPKGSSENGNICQFHWDDPKGEILILISLRFGTLANIKWGFVSAKPEKKKTSQPSALFPIFLIPVARD